MNQCDKDLVSRIKDAIPFIKQNKREIIHATLALISCWAIALVFAGQVINLLESRVPYAVVFSQNAPDEMFINIVKLAVLLGSFIAMPFILYRFMKLNTQNYDREKKTKFIKYVSLSSLMSFVGMVFAYYVTIPFQLYLLLGLNIGVVDINLNISSYLSFCLGSILLAGLLFQLPLIKFLSGKNEFYSYQELNALKKYIVGAACAIAFVILAPPIILSFSVLSISIMLFYWAAVFVVYSVQNKPQKVKSVKKKAD